MSKPILALDQGTTSSRAIVYTAEGTILGQAQREFAQIYPRPGWVEHDPMVVLESQLASAHDALHSANLRGADIAAIGITNQRETSVLWERKSGAPIGNAIVWQDRRTAEICRCMHAAGHAALFAQRTGLVLDPYFSASKIAWMLDNVAGLRARAERGEIAFGTIDSWLVWHLSAGRTHITDASNAARTLLFDIHRAEWDDELLALWNIPRAVLPDVVASSGVCATTSLFGGEIPLAGIAGDQQAALFGQACFKPGMAKCTYGTGCFILLTTGTRAPTSDNGILTTVAWQIDDTVEYALEGSVFMGGAIVQWLRDGLGLIAHASEVEALAASVASSEGVVLVPAFTGLGAPYWDPRARALLIGMTRGTTRAHIARAALDAIAWQVADVAACMQADAGLALRELRVDGGAASNNLLLQIQADTLGVAIARPHRLESTAFGAALLAGLGVGVYRDRAETAAAWQLAKRFAPATTVPARERSRALWTRAVERARDWEL